MPEDATPNTISDVPGDAQDLLAEQGAQNPNSQDSPTPAGGNGEANSIPPQPFGIGGWLAFMTFLFILSPFRYLGSIWLEIAREIIAEKTQGEPSLLDVLESLPEDIAGDFAVFYYLDSASATISTSLMYITGLIILSGSKQGRKIAYIAMLSTVVLSIVPFFSSRLLPYEVRSDMLGAIMGGTTKAIFWSTVWGLYLHLSRRCKNTYDTEYPIPPKKSWLWTGYKVLLGGILALCLALEAHGAIKMWNATSRSAPASVDSTL